jgi:hypothetical protein
VMEYSTLSRLGWLPCMSTLFSFKHMIELLMRTGWTSINSFRLLAPWVAFLSAADHWTFWWVLIFFLKPDLWNGVVNIGKDDFCGRSQEPSLNKQRGGKSCVSVFTCHVAQKKCCVDWLGLFESLPVALQGFRPGPWF